MKTRRPIDAKNTSRMLRAILPPEFKMVNDKSSNGYKYINLLYGVEVDFAREKIQKAYDNSFIDTFDLSEDSSIYEVRLSGIPNSTHLTSTEGDIKITNSTEFYDGDPTRVKALSAIPLDSGYVPSGVIGLNYFRLNERGSGYMLITLDKAQEAAFQSSTFPSYRINLTTTFDSVGDILSYSGLYTGIATQSYDEGATDEVLKPIDGKTLSGKYPLTREVRDESGIFHTIDHYEPYQGWIRDETGAVKAVVDYSGEYYYGPDGERIYFRTAYNNPYGFNNYTSAFLDLRFVPISGTLKVYDMDILDKDGNAVEIPSAGKNLFYLQSDRVNAPGSGQFDPTYLGYDATVPVGRGFSDYMEGQSANLLKTTSWSYLHEGGGLNPESRVYEDGTGPITNRIKITNPQSRYLVEYKYLLHDYSRYITILDSAGFVSVNNLDPVYSLDNISGNLVQREIKFTKDPKYILKDDTGRVVGYQTSKVATFDGLDVRPGKKLFRVDFTIPMLVAAGTMSDFVSINVNKSSIGFSDEYVPTVTPARNNYLNCPFDQEVVLNTVTELDLTGNSNLLTFQNTGTSRVIRINHRTCYGKKIIRGTGNSYFSVTGTSFLKEYVHFRVDCKLRSAQEYKLLEVHDNTTGRYLELIIDQNGQARVRMDGYRFTSTFRLHFSNLEQEFILRYRPDDVSSSVPYIELFYKVRGDLGFRQVSLFRSEETTDSVSSTYLHCFKNCSVDIGFLKIYNEVF